MKPKPDYTVAIIGVGNMGGSLVQGMLEKDWPANKITLVGKSEAHCLTLNKRFPTCKTVCISDLADNTCQAVILAVKPNNMQATCAQLAALSLPQQPIYISAAAGVPITAIQNWLQERVIVARCMPNTPTAIGLGMTGIYADNTLTDKNKAIVNDILSCTGEILWVANETMLDAVTAISGSGPAYLFYFMECLQNSAQNAGLNEQESYLLVTQMIYGAASLAKQNESSFEQLRKAVTSKGGTTEQALESLKQADFMHIINQAVTAAKERATQISQSFIKD